MHIAGSPAPGPEDPPLAMGGAAPIAPTPIAPAVPIVPLGAVKGMAPPAAEGPSAAPPVAAPLVPVAVAAPANLRRTCTQS